MGSQRPNQIGSSEESLITPEEAAKILEVTAKDIQVLIDDHRLDAYKIGDRIVRVRKDQVFELQSSKRISSDLFPVDRDKHHNAPVSMKATFSESLRDFFYFNDFYILSTVIVAALLYLILSSQH